MAKRKTKTLYYARKALVLRHHGQDVGHAKPGDLVDVEALELSRGEIRLLVDDVRALAAVEVDEDAMPETPPAPDIPADRPEEGSR